MTHQTPHTFGACLRASRLFADVVPKDLEALLRLSTQRALHDHDILFRQGNGCGEVYLVMDGLLKLYRDSGAGERKIVGFVYPGDTFCLEAMFSGEGYPFTAEAIAQCWLASFPRADLMHFLRARPEFQARVLSELSRNSSRWMQRAERMERLSAEQRLITYLVERLDETGYGGGIENMPRRRVDLANYLGMKPETLSRELKKLRDQRLISGDTGPIAVLDADSLRAMACTANA